MIIPLLTAFATQIFFTVGVIIAFGFLIGFCNKLFYKNMGSLGKACCYATGFLGTPIHECAHALMCLIFRHKITEIKLFQISSSDGTLGYVKHSYNPKNVYQKIGNFFIGIAPILVISGLIYALSLFFTPNMFDLMIPSTNLLLTPSEILPSILSSISVFFAYAKSIYWWIFLLIGLFLALHMTLSTADIKGALSGIALLLALILVTDTVLLIINVKLLNGLTNSFIRIGNYLFSIFFFSLIISLIAVIISFVFRAIKRKIGK